MSTATNAPDRVITLHLTGAQVVLVGTIQGLKGEAGHVTDAWSRFPAAPDIVALGVGAEDLTNLKRMGDEGEEGVQRFLEQELDTGSYEEAILPQLSRFGDIVMPPDDLLQAEALARDADAGLVGIDLDDEAYADLYVAHVSGWQMIRGQMRQKRLVAKGAEHADGPEDLMVLWDRAFRQIKGYDRIETEREAHMEEEIRRLARNHERILVVLPYARLEGVKDRLQE